MLDHWSQWTNDPEFWIELGLDRADCFFWRLDIHVPENYYHGWFDQQYQDITSRAGWNLAKKIFIVDREGWAADFFSNDDRVHIWDSTVLDDDHPAVLRHRPNFFWFDWVREIESYQKLRNNLIEISAPKWKFECLLGRRKPTRDWIYDRILNDNVLAKNVLLAYPGITGQWEQGFDHDGDSVESTDRVKYYDQMTGNRSCFLPWKIYNQTCYSLVSETTYDRIFFTEKTAKPLMGKRLFLLFAAAGSLKALKKIGFRTFSSLIDESYDIIEDRDQRWNAVVEQARKLSKYDYQQIKEEIKEIVDHNYQHFMAMDDRSNLKKEIKELL
jgi:hypothetical protein